MTDPMSPEELRACRERYEREADASYEIHARCQTAIANARTDVHRLLGGQCAPVTPEPRRPVAGWVDFGNRRRLTTPWVAMVALPDGRWYAVDDPDERGGREASQESAQLAAEDALFAIADAINALRGGQ